MKTLNDLRGWGIIGLRRMAGYIPSKMNIDNEPSPIIKDWRYPSVSGYASLYVIRWMKTNYQYDGPSSIRLFSERE